MKKNILIDTLTDYLALVMVVGCIYANDINIGFYFSKFIFSPSLKK